MSEQDVMVFATRVAGGLVTEDGENGVIRLETPEGFIQLALPRRLMVELMFQSLALTPRPDPSQANAESTVANVENWSLKSTSDGFVVEFQPRMGGSVSFSLDRHALRELATGMQSALDRLPS